MATTNKPIQLPLAEDALKPLVQYSNTWAMAHGMVVAVSKELYDTVTYAPHTLFPSPVPRSLYEKALHLQPGFNELMWKVANDEEFLTSVLKSTITVDDFTSRLFNIYKQVLKEGCQKPVTLALLRSDYMLDTGQEKDVSLKQVEINTMASSLAGLSIRATQMHRAILNQYIPDNSSHLPDNASLDGLSKGLLKAWELYGQPGSVILFVVRDKETNIYDINFHIYKIQEFNPSAKVIIKSLLYLGQNAQLTEDRRLIVDDMEVAVVYYRFGYMPGHFQTETEWRAKLLAEQSLAAVCPAINWHLAGTKKVQQELSRPGVLERYLNDPEVIAGIRSTFAGQYPLDLTAEGDAAAAMGIANPEKFVMKPQREGGGNNLYGDDVRTKLEELAGQQDRSAYILMDRINPTVIKNYELRRGLPVVLADMVSEMGAYGVLVCKDDKIVINETSGHLVRTKNITKDEGGIAAGASVMDSPYLS